MSNLFNILVFKPLYNGLILLIDLLPFLDVGTIIIIFTIVVKIIMLPLSIKASKSQLEMKKAEKDLAIIKKQFGDNKEEFAKKQFEYYKEKGINPFASIFIFIIQLPLLIGLYRIFLKSGLPVINTSLLYSFIATPSQDTINMVFINLINVSQKSITLAVIAGITTYFQISLASEPTSPDENKNQSELQKAMTSQMKYVFPVLMIFIGYSVSSAVSLYLITSNIFAIAQEFYIRKRYHKHTLIV